MKRFAFIICFILACTLAQAQSTVRHVAVAPAYPLVTGQVALTNQTTVLHNNLYPCNVILDNLPQYEICYILPQTVYYMENGVGFYITADSLHSNQVRYKFTLDFMPIGAITLDSISGRFNYYPNVADYRNFTARFVARSGNDSLVQEVLFTMMPSTVPEAFAFQTQGIMPSADEYTIKAETSTSKYINYQNREAWSYSISGKDIIFDNQLQNKVWGLSGRDDIYELNIYAEKLIIRSALHFPQTNLTIYAKELIFEDVNDIVSSINTSAEKHPYSNGIGLNGGNAGNISLYIKELKCNNAKRFIANGENGQSVNRNGTPGNGGNGGIITSTLNIEHFCSLSRGGGGVKFNVDGEVTDPEEIIDANIGDFISVGQAGIAGTIEKSENTQLWLHPYFVSAVLRHINDAYINLFNSISELTCNEYFNYIEQLQESEEWNDFDDETQVLLRNQQLEISTLLHNLNNELDYFGNSKGWVPLLSFEVLLENFNNEIDRAIPTLYLSYWLNHVDRTLAQWVSASSAGATQTELDITQQRIELDKIILDIPVLQDKIIQIIEQINALEIKIDNKYNELLSKAKNNIKRRNRINKAFGIAKGILSVIPKVGPALNTVAGFVGGYFGLEDKFGYAESVSGVLNPMINIIESKPWDEFKLVLQSTNFSDLFENGKNAYDSISDPLKKLSKAFDPLNKAMAKSSAPEGEVAAELAKLMAESPEWNSMQAEMTDLKNLEAQFVERLKNVNSSLQSLMTGITSNILTLDGLRRDAFTGNSKRDLQAMQYLNKMEQNAKNRLQKYFYYARKAYEYRLLKPYTSEFSLNTLYDRFEEIGVAFDENNPVNPAAHSSLASVYRNEISAMIESIIDEYTNPSSYSEVQVTRSFILLKEDLETLNNNNSLTLNMFKLGFFAPSEEDVRIVDFDIYHIEKHNVGNIGMTGFLKLILEHSGISRLRKNGEVYWFNHITKSGISPHRWGIDVDAITNNTQPIKPSYASESLLRAVLGNDNNIMLYSRPSAWSDITIIKDVYTQGGGDIMIDSVIINLTYNYTPRSTNIRNIDINVSDGLMPFITSTEPDLYGRSNGRGDFHRAFAPSIQTVSYEAPQYHGAWRFVNWTNRLEQQVTVDRQLTISKNADQYYTANYEYYLPVLQVQDTVYVDNEQGTVIVAIQNTGLEEMEWEIESNDSWLRIVGDTAGVDDAFVTIEFDKNEDGQKRVGTLTVTAPETEIFSTTVYIIQRPNPPLLKDLQVSEGILSPSFDANITNYTVNVANSITSIDVIGIADPPLIVEGNVTGKTLEVGNNVVSIKVKTEDGETKTYTVTIVRASQSASNDATLKSLTVSAGTLVPAFNPSVTSYTVNVDNSISSINIFAEANHAGATVNGTGMKQLNVGTNTFYITVTAEDGSTQRIYTLTIVRADNIPIILTFFSINSGDQVALYRTVDLNYLYSGGMPTHFRAAESAAALSSATWQSYNTNSLKYTFASDAHGAKTVYTQLRNSVNETEARSASIIYKSLHPKIAITSFALNAGAVQTSDRNVTLNHTVENGTPTLYSVSENPLQAGKYWLPYVKKPVYTLSENLGLKEVYFAVANATDTSEVVSAQIYLDESITIGGNGLIAKCFPNPVENGMNVIVEDATQPVQIRVYNFAGNVYLSQTFSTSAFTIDLSRCVPGMLIVRIQCGDKYVIKKIIKL